MYGSFSFTETYITDKFFGEGDLRHMGRQTLAVMIGTGIFFPPEFCVKARVEIRSAIEKAGFVALMMPEDATEHGGVQSTDEGRKFAAFLKAHEGKYDGVVLTLPNFGNENSAILGLRDCGTPILIQAYPDKVGLMDVKHRRDAFCGKISIMDLFHQAKLPYTVYPPHTIFPLDPRFDKHLQDFAALCRLVKRMRRVTVGAVGARTTPWKTVRIDEYSLEGMGITVETVDLSEYFHRVEKLNIFSDAYKKKANAYRAYANWGKIPEKSFETMVKAAVVLDEIIDEYKMDCLALRCWNEFEAFLHIGPCLILSELCNRGIPASCEVDVGNAISMLALQEASLRPAATLDWNNNYADEDDKCILFHCGPVAKEMLSGEREVVDNPLQAMVHGPDCAWGASQARIKPSPMTYMSARTEYGRLGFYLGEGRFTDDPIEEAFFGNAGVAEIRGLQKILINAGQRGFRHHVSVTLANCADVLREAFIKYLNYEVVDF
jgi:L-fucose isomerase-like protein